MSCDVKSSRAQWETGNECVVIHLQTLIGLNERAGEALPSGCGWADCQVTSHGERTNWFSPPDTAPVFPRVADGNRGYVAGWVGCCKPKASLFRSLSACLGNALRFIKPSSMYARTLHIFLIWTHVHVNYTRLQLCVPAVENVQLTHCWNASWSGTERSWQGS